MANNMAQMQEQIRDLGAQARAAAAELAQAAADNKTPMNELQSKRDKLKAMTDRMAALQASYSAQYANKAKELPADEKDKRESRGLSAMLKSREYARAFVDAIRAGAQPKRMADPGHRVLYDALTIAGDPGGGQDGGFLVPEDIDHTIRELRRELNPLADLFTTEAVSTNSGWRVMDKAPSMGFTALTSEIPAGGVPMDDQPEFARVTFSLTTYGLIIPVSNELAADEAANLFGYLARWYAKKQIITENKLLKDALETLTPDVIIGDDTALEQIKTLLNITLDPAISLTASILTNQDGYNFLDTMKDSDGKPLLMPDPARATGTMLKGRPITIAPNWLLPSEGDSYPIYIGDFSQFATLFTRQPLEIVSTDIGGNAFRTNSIEVRGITRMCVSAFDKEAVIRREIEV